MKMEIIIDTNFLLTCMKQKIDLFLELDRLFGVYEAVVPKQVIRELEILESRQELNIKEREAASLGLQILRKKNVKILELEGKADKAIVNYALENKDVVMASLDGGMRKHVKNKAKMLTIRNKKRIVVA